MEIRGFITNLGKYNEGELCGEWVTFPLEGTERDAVLDRIQICHTDEDGNEVNYYDDCGCPYEELFFTDWDGAYASALGEFVSIKEVNELAEEFEDVDEDVLNALLERWSFDDIRRIGVDNFYICQDVHTLSELGEYFADECGALERVPEDLRDFFDFEAYGRYIDMSCYDGGFTSIGWIEAAN